MKKNKFWLRALALCLAVACTLTIVAALSYDRNGDGKTNVWDLQLAVSKNEDEAYRMGALVEALGGKGDELHPNAQGEYEIYSPLGLYNMAQLINKNGASGKTFKLMNDVDMNGAAWQSTKSFTGTFEGNGHVICNVSVYGEISLNTAKTTFSQGFFGKIGREGAVRNLKLENVTCTLETDSKSTFVGLLAGSVLGEIENCTTVGTVIDPRTNLESKCYIGALCGRVENVPSDPAVGIKPIDESILMTAETPEVTAISGKSQKVLCKMGMEFGQLQEGSAARTVGIAGYAPDYTNFQNYNWQDISGATTVVGGTGKTYDLQDPILIARREAVVDKMYEICTVEWTPSQDMTIVYYKIGTGTNSGKLAFSRKTWEAGETYRGMPYNHGSGSLERFEAWMQDETDSSGRLVTKTELPAYAFYYTHSGVRSAINTDGANATYQDADYSFGRTTTAELLAEGWLKSVEGSLLTGYSNGVYDLSHGYNSDYVGDAVLYTTVGSADHAGFSRYIGNDCSQAIQWAWREVVSSDVKNGGTVISGVTQMAPTTEYQTRFGVLPVNGLVPNEYSVSGWCEVFDTYGKTAIMNAYAHASRGDGLIVDQTAGGHSRMIAYDPICIRNYRGVIDETNSYLITHEQGSSSSGTDENGVEWSSTCHVNRVHTFESLLDESDHNATPGGSKCNHYYPMTLPAFHNTDSAAVTSYVTYKDGVVKSNFFIISTTVDGNEVFTAVSQKNGVNSTATNKNETIVGDGYREAHLQEDMVKTHGDVTGKTITVRLSNGDIYTVNADTGAVTKN